LLDNPSNQLTVLSLPTMSRVLSALIWLTLAGPVEALTGNAPPATGFPARTIVMVVDARGDLCTGTALRPDLILTAAHCVTRPAVYRVKVFQSGQEIGVRSIVVHPQFNLESYANAHATADLALVKITTPLPEIVTPATPAASRRVAVGENLVIAGFGVTAPGTARGLGLPRMATLAVTGKPGSLQIRLVDPSTNNSRAGLGACTGDSGAPVLERSGTLIGVVSWSTGPQETEGCGGFTGVTPLLLYRNWIVETAKKLGSPLP
jgi:secreted trypsin-like serine protease